MKRYLIFHRPGEILNQDITDYIIDASRRGLITEKARDIPLVPDKRGEFRDKNGRRFRGFGRVKKNECIPLMNLVPK